MSIPHKVARAFISLALSACIVDVTHAEEQGADLTIYLGGDLVLEETKTIPAELDYKLKLLPGDKPKPEMDGQETRLTLTEHDRCFTVRDGQKKLVRFLRITKDDIVGVSNFIYEVNIDNTVRLSVVDKRGKKRDLGLAAIQIPVKSSDP